MEAPILPQDPKERQLAIRRLCQELRESKAFAWFLQKFTEERNEKMEMALSGTVGAEQREAARNQYHAFKQVVRYMEEQDAQAIEILRRSQQ